MFGVAIPVYRAEDTIQGVVNAILIEDDIDVALFVDDDTNYDSLFRNNSNVSIFYNPRNLGYQQNWNQCLDWLEKFSFGMIIHSDDIIDIIKVKDDLKKFKNSDFTILAYSKWQNESKRSFSEVADFIRETGLYLDCSSVVYRMSSLDGIRFRTDILACDEFIYLDILRSGNVITILKGDVLTRRIASSQAEYHDLANNPSRVIDAVYQQLAAVIDENSKELLTEKLCRVAFRGAIWQILCGYMPSKVYLKSIVKHSSKLFKPSLIRAVLSDIKRMFVL
jgi:hypothetical protein